MRTPAKIASTCRFARDAMARRTRSKSPRVPSKRTAAAAAAPAAAAEPDPSVEELVNADAASLLARLRALPAPARIDDEALDRKHLRSLHQKLGQLLDADGPRSISADAPAAAAPGGSWLRWASRGWVLVPVAAVPLAVLIMVLLCAGLASADAVAGGSTPPSPPCDVAQDGRGLACAAQLAATRVARALGPALRRAAPAISLGAAASLAKLLSVLRAPAGAQWLVGGIFVILASVFASGGLAAAGTPRWIPSSAVPDLAPDLPAIRAAIVDALPAGSADVAGAALSTWASQWVDGMQDHNAYAAAKLLLLTDHGARATSRAVADAIAPHLPPLRTLHLDATADCARASVAPACPARIEAFLAAATAARAPALVALTSLHAVTSDALYDATLGAVEKFVDPNERQPVLTAHGEVRASHAAFLLGAAALSAEECAELTQTFRKEKLRPAAPSALAVAVEATWPSAAFSAEVNAAKRALINRIGGHVAFACG